MKIIRPNGRIGMPHWRVEGVAKVTGRALYGSDQKPFLTAEGRAAQDTVELASAVPANAKPLLHAALRTSPVARGRITAVDEKAAWAIPGVHEILTYKDVGKQVKAGTPMLDHGYMAQAVQPLESERIYFADQVIALVVAESFEVAEQAANAIEFMIEAEEPAPDFNIASAQLVKAKSLGTTELKSGDVEKAMAKSSETVDLWYETPPQHHNAIELFQTTCAWHTDTEGVEQLTVWESTQNARGFQYGLAIQLGVKPAQVRVLSPFIGGAFGRRVSWASSRRLLLSPHASWGTLCASWPRDGNASRCGLSARRPDITFVLAQVSMAGCRRLTMRAGSCAGGRTGLLPRARIQPHVCMPARTCARWCIT